MRPVSKLLWALLFRPTSAVEFRRCEVGAVWRGAFVGPDSGGCWNSAQETVISREPGPPLTYDSGGC